MQQFAIVSDPLVAQHILKDNAKAYSKVRFTDLELTTNLENVKTWLNKEGVAVVGSGYSGRNS